MRSTVGLLLLPLALSLSACTTGGTDLGDSAQGQVTVTVTDPHPTDRKANPLAEEKLEVDCFEAPDFCSEVAGLNGTYRKLMEHEGQLKTTHELCPTVEVDGLVGGRQVFFRGDCNDATFQPWDRVGDLLRETAPDWPGLTYWAD